MTSNYPYVTRDSQLRPGNVMKKIAFIFLTFPLSVFSQNWDRIETIDGINYHYAKINEVDFEFIEYEPNSFIMTTPVTNQQYSAIVGEDKASIDTDDKEQHPVVNINFNTVFDILPPLNC